jgi:transcriptional regulator of acetoin/glycerol metabolism
VTRTSETWVQMLARAKEGLVDSGQVGAGVQGPREEILNSWRRSYDDGASTSDLRPPYDENINLSSRLFRAAKPVIERVHEDVLGSPLSVVLADSRGKILFRRAGEASLEKKLENVLLAPGFSYAERYVGTNGIGTAIEARSASIVRGAEHFNEALQAFACVGVPLRDPVSRRVLGVLDITTWADRADPALTALVKQAGTVIEEGLLELSGQGARAMLQEYLVASRRGNRQVLAISGDALIATPEAGRLIGDMPREDLWPLLRDALGPGETAHFPLLGSAGGPLRLDLQGVRRNGLLVGIIAEVCEHPSAEAGVVAEMPAALSPQPVASQVTGLAGSSPASVGAAALVSRHAGVRLPVCVIGEPGVGKKATVRAAAARHLAGRALVVHDAEALAPALSRGSAAVGEFTAEVAGQVSQGLPVLVRRAERLPAGGAEGLVAATEANPSATPGWLVLSMRSSSYPSPGPSSAEAELTAAGIPFVLVPTLRARIQDLDEIVPALVRRHAGRRDIVASPQLVARLKREPWPQNIAEVEALVKEMVQQVPGGTLEVTQLPERFGRGLRRVLSPMEWMAREAIVEALRAHAANKDKAALALGLSRASIYRKIKAFDIRPDEY